jgi:transposase
MREYLESWGMSAQRPVKQAYHQDPTKTEVFTKEIYPTIRKLATKEKAEIYFADETGINNQSYNPIGYAPKNNPPIVRVQTSRETINMLSAVSPSGLHRFMLYQETTTQQKLIEFMERLLKEKQKKKDKIFLFLDNLRVHHGKLVKAWAEEHKTEISLYYFPSYSPEINPQEYLNNILKQNIHSGIPPKNKKEIQEKANLFMKSITKDKIKMIFEHPKLKYQKA